MRHEGARARRTHVAILLPVVDGALLGHELVDGELAALEVLDRDADCGCRTACDSSARVSQKGSLELRRRTERRKLLVALVDFSRAAPQAARDAHRGEDAVVIEEEAFERLFDEDEVEVRQARGDGLHAHEGESARGQRVES